MDERIFNFNKIVIDTVYDIICFLYPVTGGARDFARFYVLETVARVPYFAYLSVMHLRETFGERDPKLGERTRVCVSNREEESLAHLMILAILGLLLTLAPLNTLARAHIHTCALHSCPIAHIHAYSLRLITSSTTC
jgi:hypothetical protein